MSSPYPKTIAMLEAWGIDPDSVSVDGFDEDGYFTFIRDADGNRTIRNGLVLRQAHRWPEGCDSALIINQFRAEGGQVG